MIQGPGDELFMDLVDSALSRPREEREGYLRDACGGDGRLFDEVWDYVEGQERMRSFLSTPVLARPPSEHPFQPGDILDGRFHILREVARGGMGMVYEAYDSKLDRRIALKCAKFEHRRHLPREVRNASEVSHPNVCKIFEIHTASTPAGETDFITMEFLDGETLSSRLQRGPIPEPEARAIARQLCEGLAEAHLKQVIHGDLKSGNVILTTDAGGTVRAVITDFGLAHRPDAAPGTVFAGQAGGTPAYMAPELWRGEKATVASDLYALGVILFELIAGKRPDELVKPLPPAASTVTLEAGADASRHTGPLPSVHPKWDRIVARCMDPDPARRFGSATEVLRALAPSRTRRRVLMATAAVLLAVVPGVVTYRRATAPQSVVRLAVLPFQPGPGTAALTGELTRRTAGELSRLKGSSRTGFEFVPLSAASRGATHVLRGSLLNEDGRLMVHAYLTDTRTGVDAKEWSAQYAPAEIRFAPTALAGMVTGAFELAPVASGEVNAAARPDYLSGLAEVRRKSRIDAALAALGRAEQADSDSPLTHAALAEAQWFKYFDTRDKSWLDRATESVRQAELRNPDLAPVRRVAGLLKANAGWYQQAEADYRRAIQLDPKNADAQRRLGQACESNNQLQEALVAYQQAVELEPSDYRNHQQMGAYYLETKSDFEEAAKHFRKAVALAPDEPETHRVLARALMEMGRFAEAENEMRAALRLAESPVSMNTLAVILMYQGRDREAIPYIRRALGIRPDMYLWWLDLCIAYRQLGLTTESKKACARGLALAEAEMVRDPRDGYVRSALGYLTGRLGDARRAESEISQALRLSPADSETRFFSVLTYEALGRREDALAVLRTSPKDVVADLSRWPEVADLHRDPRFIQLLASHQIKQGDK